MNKQYQEITREEAIALDSLGITVEFRREYWGPGYWMPNRSAKHHLEAARLEHKHNTLRFRVEVE